jgi:hypothetical protein
MGERAAGDFESWRRKIALEASRQWGHVRRQQLLAMGIPPTTIAHGVRDGRLISIHAGIYAVGYRRIDPMARAAAAVLAGYPDAVLSHESAAALWDLRRWPGVPEITSPRHIRRRGIRAHRAGHLPSWDITIHWGIPTVTAFRALVDIQPHLTDYQRTRLPNTAFLRHLITRDEAEYLRGHRRNATRSGNEDLFQRIVEDHDLPQPETNEFVCGREADAWFPDERVVVEIDDLATHGDPKSFAENRRLDAPRAAHGILTVRLLAEDLTVDPARQAKGVQEILATRRR